MEMKTKIIRKWLSLMKGQEWKDIRSSVTPAFTTGKIKRVILI
jgi:cytochrome P450 family 3 subfamily A